MKQMDFKENRLRRIVVFVIFMFFSISAFAGGSVSGTVKSVVVRETGNIEVVLNSNHSNPDSCAQSEKVVIDNNHIAKKEMMSIVLFAMAQGKKTIYWVSDCISAYDPTYPNARTATVVN